MTTLQQRIARIVSPPTDELAAKRGAKFGRLNVEQMPFRITVRHNAAPYRILEEQAVERMLGRSL